MRKIPLPVWLLIIVGGLMVIASQLSGCQKPLPPEQLQAQAEQRMNCLGQAKTIKDITEVTFYMSGAIGVCHLRAADPPEACVFFSPDDRLTIPVVIEDLPEGSVPWAYLEPKGAWPTGASKRLTSAPADWTCLFSLKIHLSPASKNRIIDDHNKRL